MHPLSTRIYSHAARPPGWNCPDSVGFPRTRRCDRLDAGRRGWTRGDAPHSPWSVERRSARPRLWDACIAWQSCSFPLQPLGYFHPRAPGLPIAVSALPPLRKVLFPDGSAPEIFCKDCLYLRQRIKPVRQLRAQPAVIKPLVQLLPNSFRKPRYFSGSCHCVFFLSVGNASTL